MQRMRIALLGLLLCVFPRAAAADERPVYVKSVPDAATFSRYARTVEGDELGKFILDLTSGEILYFDVRLFPLHRDFVFKAVLQREITPEERREYLKNYGEHKPRFVLGYLTHHLAADTWDLSFWEEDRIRPEQIRDVRARLLKTFFRQDIRFRPDSTRQEKLLAELQGIPTITNDQLYKQAPFQAFNPGHAVGTLRIVPPGTDLEEQGFARTDIVVLQESYPDLSPVAGIICTTFATPLSHVNLRARSWRIPNAGIKDAATRYRDLDGKTVSFNVTPAGHTLRIATARERSTWRAAKVAGRKVLVPRANLTRRELLPVPEMEARDADTYGTKAANLGQIARRKLAGVQIPAGFGIPIVYYAEHLRRHGLDRALDALLRDPRYGEVEWRKAEFLRLRERIRAAPIEPELLRAVAAKIVADLGGAGVFVRSSTNAEDLPGFNGAGLYDTVPNVKGDEALEAAIKQVWASLWNTHAVAERELYGIAPNTVYAAVLVQAGLAADAAGVLVTKNLYDPEDDHSYTINAKQGLGLRVVGGTTVPEQVIYDVKYPGARIISRSDDATKLVFDEHGGLREVATAPGAPVLTERQCKALATAVQAFVPLFPRDAPLDVEWVLAGGMIWIVQARPFVE